MSPVRLRLTVERDQVYNWIGIEENASPTARATREPFRLRKRLG